MGRCGLHAAAAARVLEARFACGMHVLCGSSPSDVSPRVSSAFSAARTSKPGGLASLSFARGAPVTVLVTGATGNVGAAVVLALRAEGVQARAAAHDVEKVASKLGTEVDAVRLDFRDPATFPTALRGCSALFLLRPPPIADMKATLIPFVDAARAHGVGQVVFLSVAGAESNRLVPHHAVEVHLAAQSQKWTVLRPGFFAQNLGDAYRRDIVEDERIYVPAGRGRAAFVDVRDVAEVAAQALVDPPAHAAKAYTLTGPEAVSFTEAAAILTAALGRSVRYERATIPGYALHLHRRGMPAAQIAVQTILHVGLRFGQAEPIDPTLARLLGRPGRTLTDYVSDHVATWSRKRTS